MRKLLASYPSLNLHDPEGYVADIVSLLTGYPFWAGERAVDKIKDTSKFVPTRAEIKPLLEEQVRIPRYAEEWDRGAQETTAARLEGPAKERRETYEELKACYGENWGIASGSSKSKPLTLEEVRQKYGAEKVDAVPNAGDWQKLKYDFRMPGAELDADVEF